MKSIASYFKGDKTIWMIIMFLSIISLLAVYSSTGTLAYKSRNGNTEYFVIKHAFIMFGGFLAMFFFHRINYLKYKRFAAIATLVSIPLLLFTLLMGSNINDANRWIALPIVGLTFQTSDFAKVALIMFVSARLSNFQDKIDNFKEGFLPIAIAISLVCLLILPANFSTAAVLLITCLVLCFIGRTPLKFIFGMLGVFISIFILYIFLSVMTGKMGRINTWINRIENFFNHNDTVNNDKNYQVVQAKIAVATGGFLGKGPGNSSQRNFLPHPYSDFIFAIIIEEYGLLGGTFVVFLYLLLFYRVLLIVKRTQRAFSALIAIGFAFSLVFQGMINMAVAVDIFPVTGQPLPLLSMGGTSIIFTCIALGIILSVSADIYSQENSNVNNSAIA